MSLIVPPNFPQKPIITFFDTESTGLDTDKDRVIEIAMLCYNFYTGEQLAKYVRRFKNMIPIKPDAEAVHGISESALVNCPEFKDCWPEMAKVFGVTTVIAGHNIGGFDIPIMFSEITRAGYPMPQIEHYIDTIDATWATPDGKRPKLQELCFALGVDYDPTKAHAALYDVEVNAAAYFAARERGYFQLAVQQGQW